MTKSVRPTGNIIPCSKVNMEILEESPMKFPTNGWFTTLNVESPYSKRHLLDILSRMVKDGILEFKKGKVKTPTGIKPMNLYRQI